MAEVLEREEQYPESTMFGILPAYGFFCRHVDGLTFRDVELSHDEPELRPALMCEDVRRLRLDGFNAEGTPEALAQIVLRNTQEVMVSGSWAAATGTLLRLEDHCDRITVIGNDLSDAKAPIVLDPSTPKSALYAAYNRLQNAK